MNSDVGEAKTGHFADLEVLLRWRDCLGRDAEVACQSREPEILQRKNPFLLPLLVNNFDKALESEETLPVTK
jgi:hypothetical protein